MNEEIRSVQAVLNGDKESYGFFIEKYKNKLFAIVLRVVKDEKLTVKIVEDCFDHAYENLNSYKETEFFSHWFYQQVIPTMKEKVFDASSDESRDIDYVHFYNPRYVRVEEAILALTDENRFEFLCCHIMGMRTGDLADILEMNAAEMEKRESVSLASIRNKIADREVKERKAECMTHRYLSDCLEETLSENERKIAENHLEFCPDCRDTLENIKKETTLLEEVLHYPKLDDAFNEKVLSKLFPYTKKEPTHRSWKYQLGAIGVLVSIFLFIFIALPNIKPATNMLLMYMKHGTIHNVWAEGTYMATDKERTIEVTGVEIDPLQMLIYLDRSGKEEEGIEIINDQERDLIDIQIIDREGTRHSVEFSQPFFEKGNEPLDETITLPSYIVKATNGTELPDEFNLHIQIYRFQGWNGNWKIEIPIRYDKVEDSVEVVELNEIVEIDNKIEIEFFTMEYAKYGSRLTYRAQLKEEEIRRIENRLKQTQVRYNNHSLYNYKNIHPEIRLANEENYLFMPFRYHSYYMGNRDMPIQQDFSRLYTDPEHLLVKGKAEEFGKNFAEVVAVYYSEPAFYSFTIPLEETEDEPLNINLDGSTLKNYSLTALGSDTYRLTINATRDSNINLKQFNWLYTGENAEIVYVSPIHLNSGIHPPEEVALDQEFVMVDVEIRTSSDSMGKITIQAESAFNSYQLNGEEWRVPLFHE